MNQVTGKIGKFGLAPFVGLACLFLSDNPSSVYFTQPFVTEAQAVIGRPLTPMSYAGVARRTTRRAYYGGAAYGAAAYGAAAGAVAVGAAAAGAARCVQVVDAYGRIIPRCY